MQYVLQDGLDIGVPYSIKHYPTSLNPATGGCRNITGIHNWDGTVTIFAITSTISANGDTGADPNKLVKVTDRVSDTMLPPAADTWATSQPFAAPKPAKCSAESRWLRGMTASGKKHDSQIWPEPGYRRGSGAFLQWPYAERRRPAASSRTWFRKIERCSSLSCEV